MKRKIILCRGIQGSGKSTWAKRYCEEHPNTIRLNRDDIRKMVSQKWSPQLEDMVKATEYSAMISALCSHMDVVIDDVSNLNANTRKIIDVYLLPLNLPEGREIVTQDFFIPLQDCIKRDSLREEPIGEEIIKKTYKMYKSIIENRRNEQK